MPLAQWETLGGRHPLVCPAGMFTPAVKWHRGGLLGSPGPPQTPDPAHLPPHLLQGPLPHPRRCWTGRCRHRPSASRSRPTARPSPLRTLWGSPGTAHTPGQAGTPRSPATVPPPRAPARPPPSWDPADPPLLCSPDSPPNADRPRSSPRRAGHPRWTARSSRGPQDRAAQGEGPGQDSAFWASAPFGTFTGPGTRGLIPNDLRPPALASGIPTPPSCPGLAPSWRSCTGGAKAGGTDQGPPPPRRPGLYLPAPGPGRRQPQA